MPQIKKCGQPINENLLQENTERKGIEEVLAKENKKLQMIEILTRDNLLNQLTTHHECLDLANTIRKKDPAMVWEHITKAELVLDQTIKSLR